MLVLGIAATAYGCEPDLDSLSSRYDELNGGRGGKGTVNEGGTPEAGGMSTGGVAGQPMNGGTGGSSEPAPACSNGKQGSDESDVDCGGRSECDRCEIGKACSRNDDCASTFCSGRQCVEPTCDDEVQNQDETDADCGGTCAPDQLCAIGEGCVKGTDCASDYCDDGECKDHCTSHEVEADETDVDCGGAECGGCEDDATCFVNEDCLSGVCTDDACVPASCDDGIHNQEETDVDCGGSCVEEKPCSADAKCKVAADCESYICEKGLCKEDVAIEEGDLIDDMETPTPAILSGLGTWYPFGDESEGAKLTIGKDAIAGKRGTSTYAMHTTGSGFVIWGAGIGFDFNHPDTGHDTKLPFDASGYVALTFWARSSETMNLRVLFPDFNTDPSGKKCTVCGNHWMGIISVSPEWKRYIVPIVAGSKYGGPGLVLEPGVTPVPTEPAISQMVGVQFRPDAGITYDYWIDDVAFLR